MRFRQLLVISGLLMGAGTHTALAQSDVTIYGVMDIFFASQNGGGNSMTAMDGRGALCGSRLGFKGSEDLGGGLKALYTIEYSLTPARAPASARAARPGSA